MKRIMKSLTVMFAMCILSVMPAQAKSPESVYLTETQQQRYVVVNGVNVRLRFEPNLSSSYLHYDNGTPRYAPKGTYLKYLGQKGDFYYVQYAGYKVYISKQYSYLSGGSSSSASAGNSGKYYVVINGVNVRLRTGPSTNYPYFTWNDGSPCYLPKGSYLNYLGQAGDFYKCSYQGHTVYISKKFSYITK
ncbi:MAG: hypothetical protein K5893_09965 [Prevotella sp.]|nr:hypothetical protein [Prevotella sp.]